MSTTKQTAGNGENPGSVGRITPVNMQSETRKLDASSLMRDMAKGGSDIHADCHHCHLWA